MTAKPPEKRQVVRFAFYKLDGAWRRLSAERQASSKIEFGQAIESFTGRLLLRPYGLVGIRGDCDFLLWQVAEDLDSLVALQTALNGTDLGAYLTAPYSYLAMTRRSIYEFPEDPGQPSRLVIRPSDARYLFVYPFIKTRGWYMLPKAERQTMMDEHVRVGRQYPSIRLNTTYSYGLDDQEFIVAFEGDNPAEFLDLVMELRESKASSYTLRDTPTFTCVQMSLWDMLDTLGGAGSVQALSRRPARADGYTPVATLADVPPGSGRRVYAGGDAVALFNVNGSVHAIANRCSHARASLSEGTVDAARCAVTCPWHEGVFSLETGQVLGGPPSLPVATYRVKLEGETILIAPAEAREPTVAPHS
jgi:chlorite dismutase/nitrite reductase/ring-hydroxylating ferredoxin subunit